MKVFINEFDNDYRTVTETIEKEFSSIEEARIWCGQASWSGYSYFVDVNLTRADNAVKEVKVKPKLTKEQMFDFILENSVTISPDGSTWTKHDDAGNVVDKFKKKYTVSINNSGMSGFDLEEAIQYYHDNLSGG